jgi:uncharacterized membrane protein
MEYLGIKKNKIFNILLIGLFSVLLFFLAFNAKAEENVDENFRAIIISIIEREEIKKEDGSISFRQKLKVEGLEKKWSGREIFIENKENSASFIQYNPGDKVVVNYSPGPDGEENFYIIGFYRLTSIYLLAFLFALSVIIVGRLKGLRALIVLIITFFIILKFIIPQILAGSNPLLISIIGSFFILFTAIYITEGFKLSSSVAILSILFSLLITAFLSIWFTSLTKLTGFASEEVGYLIDLFGGQLNVRGLLLAGIIIGALGVLDDVVISQVMLVKELKIANPNLSRFEIYRQAMRVGVSHLSSMVNTLFLAYAGASLPLLILFSVKQPPFLTFNQVLNNEIIATEIVRSLAGSIGLILAVPISTFLAAYLLKNKNLNK